MFFFISSTCHRLSARFFLVSFCQDSRPWRHVAVGHYCSFSPLHVDLIGGASMSCWVANERQGFQRGGFTVLSWDDAQCWVEIFFCINFCNITFSHAKNILSQKDSKDSALLAVPSNCRREKFNPDPEFIIWLMPDIFGVRGSMVQSVQNQGFHSGGQY